MDELLTTRQVAAELQVSESSVKRWCDLGIIRTQRTAGGHRRIERSGLEEFLASTNARSLTMNDRTASNPLLRQQVLQDVTPAVVGTRQVAEAVESYSHTSRETLVQWFQQALVAGDEQRCREIILDWSQRYRGVAQLGDLLVAGAMERIGRMWECGRAEVFEERRSCEICTRLIGDLRMHIPEIPATAPRAIGGTLSGDHYTLANQLVELVLREAGWHAMSLGANLPMETLLAAVRREKPRLLWLSISYVDNQDKFVSDYNKFYSELPPDLVVAVGGKALTDELRPRIGYTAHCDNLEQLSALAHVISGTR